MTKAYPHIFPVYIPAVGIASLDVRRYTTKAPEATFDDLGAVRSRTEAPSPEGVQPVRARVDAPSPVNMSRDPPSAPPSPPDPAELDDSAPAAAEFDALATVEQEVEKLDGLGDALN